MKNFDTRRIQDSLIDVSTFPTDLSEGEVSDVIARGTALVDTVVQVVEFKNGFAVLHGAGKMLAAHGLDVRTETGAETARRFHESIFRAAAARFDIASRSPVQMAYDRIARMDVDGYNKNKNFTPNSDHTESREFVTTKCVHFDAATPFIANLYGPNQNIRDGLPMICDTRGYCQDRGVDPRSLIEAIPNNYNVAVKQEHADEILRGYSIALKLDLDNDVVMIVIYNEVVGGVAHAATQPELTLAGKSARRPIRHIEYQVASADDLKRWYDYYGLTVSKATDHKEDASTPRYHRGELNPFHHIVEVSV